MKQQVRHDPRQPLARLGAGVFTQRGEGRPACLETETALGVAWPVSSTETLGSLQGQADLVSGPLLIY